MFGGARGGGARGRSNAVLNSDTHCIKSCICSFYFSNHVVAVGGKQHCSVR